MPLYLAFAPKGLLNDDAKSGIAEDITRIHCDVTGALPDFVHVFFQESPDPVTDHSTIEVLGRIRAGRSDEQKATIRAEICQSLAHHAGIALERTSASTTDTPAGWIMEAGAIMPEPGEEEAWLARYHREAT